MHTLALVCGCVDDVGLSCVDVLVTLGSRVWMCWCWAGGGSKRARLYVPVIRSHRGMQPLRTRVSEEVGMRQPGDEQI